jgi:hypothetical protein
MVSKSAAMRNDNAIILITRNCVCLRKIGAITNAVDLSGEEKGVYFLKVNERVIKLVVQ